MKIKIFISLSADLLERLGRVDHDRSVLIEQAALEYLARVESKQRDLEIIDRNADRLNREAMDTLDYQQFL